MAEARALASGSSFKAAMGEGRDWREAAERLLAALGDPPPGANLAFLYATDVLAADLGRLADLLARRSGIAHWVGTVGLGVLGSGTEIYDRPALSLLTCALPPDSFRVFGPLSGDLAAFKARHGEWIALSSPVFAVVQGDPRTRGLPSFVARFAAFTSCYLVGGLSASRGALPQLCDRLSVSTGGDPGEGGSGMSGVLFDPSLQVATGLSQGCSPIGPLRTVTAAEGAAIKEIDGRPALDALKEDVGELLARNLERIGGYIQIAFPAVGSEQSDYLVRNLTILDTARGWIAGSEAAARGRHLFFVRRDPEAARRDLARMAAETLSRAGGAPRAGLYFSCLARGRALFGPHSAEMAILREQLGDLPLTGFFANGELSNDRLYGYTGVLTLIQ